MRLLPILCALLVAGAPSAAPGADGRDVMRRECLDCHSGSDAEGGFDAAALLALEAPAPALFEWRRGQAMVEADAMPPRVGLERDDRRALLALFADVERDALERGGAAGFEPARRLTRAELGRTLEALLGVRVDVDSMLPAELVVENGFAANSATLLVHSEWLVRAGAATRIALERALPDAGSISPALEPTSFDLERFLLRAFRRPPTADELGEVAAALERRLDAGASDRAALRETLGDVLASPHVLLRVEDAAHEDAARPDGAAPGGAERAVGEYGLASRLSFLAWGAPPDEVLLARAAAGELSDPAALREEARRLFADPRALAFGDEFGGQWLGTNDLGFRVKPDPIDVPFMTDSLMAAMRAEVAHFVLALFAERRPLDDLLRADFGFANAELADFYDVRGVEGDQLVRVRHRDARRYGILGKAAVLATTSYPDRTSPVLRGAWVLDDLLGTPPPPPPPDAGEFDDEAFERGESRGLRGVLEAHRDSSSCRSCHERIDPLGFGLHGFDQYGRVRKRDEEGARIDDSGQLPEGARFDGPEELAEVLLKLRRADLAREVSRRLLAYSLARPLTWEDERTVSELAMALSEGGFGALLDRLVTSRPFRFVATS